MKLTLPGNNHRHQIELLATPEYFEYHPAYVTPCLVDLNLTAPTFVEEDNTRAQVDLVAVIDRSGSMSGDKINLVKETLLFVLTQLTAKDRLCLIVFELTYVTEESRSYLRSKINSVTVRGRTNLCGGLLEGMRTVTSRTGVMADVASVLLLTDGLANVGISSTRGILKAMRFGEKQKKKTVFPSFPGTVYTFGYGSNHNASMLKEISQAGNGMYFFIDTNEKISKSFTMCTRGLLSTVGQNINLLVELSNGATITEVIAKKTPTYNTNKTSVEVALGDLQFEEERDVLMEIQLPACPDLATEGAILNYAAVTLSYFNVITAVMETVTADLPVSRTDTGKPKTSNPLVDKQKNRITTIKALEKAKKKADEGKYEEGRQLLLDQQQVIRSSTCDHLMVKDINDVIHGMSEERYGSYGEHRCISASQSQTEQRLNFSSLPTTYSLNNPAHNTQQSCVTIRSGSKRRREEFEGLTNEHLYELKSGYNRQVSMLKRCEEVTSRVSSLLELHLLISLCEQRLMSVQTNSENAQDSQFTLEEQILKVTDLRNELRDCEKDCVDKIREQYSALTNVNESPCAPLDLSSDTSTESHSESDIDEKHTSSFLSTSQISFLLPAIPCREQIQALETKCQELYTVVTELINSLTTKQEKAHQISANLHNVNERIVDTINRISNESSLLTLAPELDNLKREYSSLEYSYTSMQRHYSPSQQESELQLDVKESMLKLRGVCFTIITERLNFFQLFSSHGPHTVDSTQNLITDVQNRYTECHTDVISVLNATAGVTNSLNDQVHEWLDTTRTVRDTLKGKIEERRREWEELVEKYNTANGNGNPDSTLFKHKRRRKSKAWKEEVARGENPLLIGQNWTSATNSQNDSVLSQISQPISSVISPNPVVPNFTAESQTEQVREGVPIPALPLPTNSNYIPPCPAHLQMNNIGYNIKKNGQSDDDEEDDYDS